MKHILLLPFVLLGLRSVAQSPITGTVHDSNLVSYLVPADRTLHILAPEPILYVDISSPDVDGDLPEKNLCRLKPAPGKMAPGSSFTVTVVTASLISVSQLIVADSLSHEPRTYVITLEPKHWVRMNERRITEPEFRSLALHTLSEQAHVRGVKARNGGIRYRVNNLFVIGDYLMLDLSVENMSNLDLDIDEVRFTLSGRKPVSAQISQDMGITPIYTHQAPSNVIAQSNWRNIYLFEKFHFSSDKVLRITLSEQQISGRNLELTLDNRRLMQARHLDH
jgi:conjugative transposon TraN protein